MIIRGGTILLLLLGAQYAFAAPHGNYRLFERLADLTVVGPKPIVGTIDKSKLGNFNDLAFDSQGRMYGVVRRNVLAIYDPKRGEWRHFDGDKLPIVGDVNRGLVTHLRQANGRPARTELDPARLPAISGYAEQIAIGPDDRVWVTTHDFTVYRQAGDSWERIPGLAKSIEVGAEGSVYAMHVAEAPDPRRDERKMRPIPTAERIQRWNGSGWDLLPKADIWQIRSLAVGPDGTPWIAYDKYDAGWAGSVVARFTNGAWEPVSPQGMYMPHGLAFDENGRLWMDVERDWPDGVRTRAFMTWQGSAWQHEFNIPLGTTHHAFDVFGGLPRLGLFGVSDGRPLVADGWVHYPGLSLDDLKLSPNGDVWVSYSYILQSAPRDESLRWLGGNLWGNAKPGRPAAFYSDGEWVDPHLNLPMPQRRGGFENVARFDDDTYFGSTLNTVNVAGAETRFPIVYRVENGRSEQLGDEFRGVHALAVDDRGRAWVHAQPNPIGQRLPTGYYRWENGAWTGVEFPDGFEPGRNMQTGLDGAVVFTGYRPDFENRTAVAIWRDDKWSLVTLPPRTSLSRATTDRDGKIWGLGGAGISHQEGAIVAFDVPEPRPAKTVATGVEATTNPTSQSETQAAGGTAELPLSSKATKNAVAAIEDAAALRTGDLIGCWAWSNGASITILENGQAHNGLSPAPWTATGERGFEIVWPELVASITVAPGGSTMSEQSLFGNLTGQRTGGSGESFEGSWQLNNGATAIAAADGSYQIGTFKGSWKKAPGARRFEVRWPVHDVITVNADGGSLSGSNQFGAFTATKTPCN